MRGHREAVQRQRAGLATGVLGHPGPAPHDGPSHPQLPLALGPGEAVWLWRQRRSISQPHAAAKLGCTELQLLATENYGAPLGPWADEETWDLVDGVGALRLVEQFMVMRRRAGYSQAGLGRRLGCSRVWVGRLERGQERNDCLLSYWLQPQYSALATAAVAAPANNCARS